MTLLLVWCHCPYVCKIQSIVPVNIIQNEKMVKFTTPQRVYVTNATDFPTFGKHKGIKMSGQ
jgi:hypothetical protein